MSKKFDFSGWATKANLLCSDGVVITNDAFKHCDGITVPLVWNHQHNDPDNVLGHALLEHRDGGMYAYCSFNDTEAGIKGKKIVEHGDVVSLSIYANKLKRNGSNVIHGEIREVSLVLAGANPGAKIEHVIKHADDMDDEFESSGAIFSDEDIYLEHDEDVVEEEVVVEHSDGNPTEEQGDNKMNQKETKERTVQDVYDEFTEEQLTVVHALVGAAIEETEAKYNNENPEGGNENMKHNAFDNETRNEKNVLSHAEQSDIIKMAQSKSVGSLQEAIATYAEDNKDTLAHGIDEIETLFPEYKDVKPGAPELIQRDQGWVGTVMNKVHKSPISRIRTRQADITGADLRASGYEKGKLKKDAGNIKLLKRTTDPQTVYRKDALHRDDIIDITDFDVVAYQYNVMKQNLNEEIAMAIMVGDGREDGDEAKISEEHIRSIWHDDELYTIHKDVDIAAAKAELQGSDTSKHFGDNYVYAEALVTASLYSREKYKGSGSLEFYCTPHLLNVMLLARDLNGRRIYDSKADLAAALNVTAIHTAEQFEGLTRTTKDGKTKKLLGLLVNLNDYQVGSTKGGEITRFNQFDIDFNQEKYLIETRISGALTRVKSAIALEEDVTE